MRVLIAPFFVADALCFCDEFRQQLLDVASTQSADRAAAESEGAATADRVVELDVPTQSRQCKLSLLVIVNSFHRAYPEMFVAQR